jgi:hypothetical protein
MTLSHSGNFPRVINELPVEILLKRRAEKPNDLFHAQSVRRRLNSYNFGAGLDYGKTTGSIVCTIVAEIVRTIIQSGPQTTQLFEQKNTIPNGLDSRNYRRAVSRN